MRRSPDPARRHRAGRFLGPARYGVGVGVPTFWLIVVGVYAAMSLVSFCAYGVDKRRARLGRRRTPEATLLLIDLLGGWPGGFVGRRFWRHKTVKASYRLRFALVVIVHVALWAALARLLPL